MVVGMIFAVLGVAIAVPVGYVMWRDRGRNPSSEDRAGGLGAAESYAADRHARSVGVWGDGGLDGGHGGSGNGM
jgi:hypothetical protein